MESSKPTSDDDDIVITPSIRAYLRAFTKHVKNPESLALERARKQAFLNLKNDQTRRDRNWYYPLSKREAEIIDLRLRGHEFKEISAILGTSVHTVGKHMTNAYGKIGTSDPFRVCIWALGRGFLIRDDLHTLRSQKQ